MTEIEVIRQACARAAAKHPKRRATVTAVRAELNNKGSVDRIAKTVKSFNAEKIEQETLNLPTIDLGDLNLEQEDELLLSSLVQSLEKKYREKEKRLLASLQQKEASLEEHYAQLIDGFNQRQIAFDASEKAYQQEIEHLRNQQDTVYTLTEGYIEKISELKRGQESLEESVQLKEAQIQELKTTLAESEKKAEDQRLKLSKQYDESQALLKEEAAKLEEALDIQVRKCIDLQNRHDDLNEIYNKETARLYRELDLAKRAQIETLAQANKEQRGQQKVIDMLMAARNDIRTELGTLKQKIAARDVALNKAKQRLRKKS
ncbi:coiled-coil domain-containing protein [Piscirickettsia litoralis]|uniref:KfrA N-terminal DNA-binding domain-containing protein n=1 Tax=Piscirickettsia litoralis TaxID=1891921 RepID=A0ABX2ZXF8_9GAMM|nr:hypothetical protein [Piscirickettsia litoralis]ODN41299.1 hypothetical protein BGC07_17195 [Piscirickettsia litoralis]